MNEQMSYSLGRIGIFARGEYSPLERYNTLDVVTFNGSGYVATQPSEGETPSESSAYWSLLAARGAVGPQGEQGPQGVGVSNVSKQYYLSDSSEAPSGGTWTATPPAWTADKYLWTRTTVVYTSGATQSSEPMYDSSWEALRKSLHFGPSAPAAPTLGKLWMDTGVMPNVLRIYDGVDATMGGWTTVTDSSTLEEANRELAEQLQNVANGLENLQTAFAVDEQGAHIYKERGRNEVLITPKDVQIQVGGDTYSRFLASALQLGDFRLWQPADGGLAFAPMDDEQ